MILASGEVGRISRYIRNGGGEAVSYIYIYYQEWGRGEVKPFTHSHSLTHLLTLTRSLTHPHSLTHSLTHSPSHSPTSSLTQTHIHSLTHSLTQPRIRTALEACLLTDAEYAAGPESWRTLADPFCEGKAAELFWDLPHEQKDEPKSVL